MTKLKFYRTESLPLTLEIGALYFLTETNQLILATGESSWETYPKVEATITNSQHPVSSAAISTALDGIYQYIDNCITTTLNTEV